MIAPNVILIWPSTNATIPTGYIRETQLDSKFLKAADAGIDPGITGGSNTHTHSGGSHSHSLNAHSHTFSLDKISDLIYGSIDPYPLIGVSAHGHSSATSSTTSGGTLQSQSVTWSSANNEPPYYKVIFIKATNWRSIPDNVIALWNAVSLPSGFLMCNGASGTPDLRNKYLKGAVAGGDGGVGSGATSHQHTITHSHTSSNHSHTGTSGYETNNNGYRPEGGSSGYAHKNHRHTVTLNNTNAGANAYTNTTAGSSDTVEPAYKKILAIQNKSGKNKIPVFGIIGLWLGTLATIPVGWALCDGSNGTPDLRSKFIKIANTTGEIGNTGGSNTHSHSSVAHSHTATGTHSHTGTSGGGDTSASLHMNWTHGVVLSGHTHPVSGISSATATWANANVTCNVVDNQPAYRTVAYIMLKFMTGGALFFNLL